MVTAMQDTIEREIVVRAPKERVYNAITDPTQIVKWFPDAVEGTLEAGARPVFDFGKYGKQAIQVIAADPHDYFAYRWIPGGVPEGSLGDPLKGPHTLVEFRLEEVSDGTRVRLLESGFASLPAAVYAKSLENNSEGWTYMLERLEKYLA